MAGFMVFLGASTNNDRMLPVFAHPQPTLPRFSGLLARLLYLRLDIRGVGHPRRMLNIVLRGLILWGVTAEKGQTCGCRFDIGRRWSVRRGKNGRAADRVVEDPLPVARFRHGGFRPHRHAAREGIKAHHMMSRTWGLRKHLPRSVRQPCHHPWRMPVGVAQLIARLRAPHHT